MPIPPFHSRSTGAVRMAEISSSGDNAFDPGVEAEGGARLRRAGTDFTLRGQTPPPGEIRVAS